MHGQRSFRRGCIGLVVIGLLLITLACGLSGLAMQRGAIEPPAVELRTGPVDLLARTIWNTTCAPISACILTERPVYMVWVVVRRPGAGAQSYRLLRIWLERRT
jgi:hypothetical protein